LFRFPPLVGRFVPFIAVAAANCINIPCMRSVEFSEGTPITDENGEPLGKSAVVGRRAIGKVLISRILMAAPGMREFCFSKLTFCAFHSFTSELLALGVLNACQLQLCCRLAKHDHSIGTLCILIH
uniref:Secreted protein n=1 Tax=Echinostoma caproni TaxID=27848 RepID=A0A183BFI1_9TREM